MTWIKTTRISESDEKLRHAMEAQRALYPIEYAEPIYPTPDGQSSDIVASHSLIPAALYHAFATFGSLMSPELPLTRRQTRDDYDRRLSRQSLSLLNRISRRVSASRYPG